MTSFATTPITGGVVVICHVPDPEHADAFGQWYESDVIPPILDVPGVRGATRYRATEDWARSADRGMVPFTPAANHLTVFGLSDIDVARSEAFIAATGHSYRENRPSIDGNTLDVHRRFVLTAEGIGRMDNPPRDEPSTARGLLFVSLTAEPDWTDRLEQWYDQVHLPELLECPGFIGAHRWRVLEGLPNVLAFYDLDSADTLKSDEFRAVSGRPVEKLQPLAQEMLQHRTTNICTTYEETFHTGERLPY